ncbi:MAG: ABC transporter substrate-binding protein [Planctomycetota bacterium]
MVRGLLILLPGLLVEVAFAVRPRPAPTPTTQIVIITPHGEAIRAEFGSAFAAWAKRELHQDIGIDWRTPGGTGDIVKYLDSRYTEALAKAHPELSDKQLKLFNDPAIADPARTIFLASNLDIGIDIFFGGGEFQHRQQANKGYLVDAGLLRSHPEWFKPEIIPPMLTGERMFDPAGRYYGACLAVFGLADNFQRLRDLVGDPPPQLNWRLLGDPRLFGATVTADATKSGATVTACERILQSEIVAACADPDHPTAAELERGWIAGWSLLRRMCANAGWVADGTSRAVRAVARGEAALGMCLDFHARAEAEWSQIASGTARLGFVIPPTGTSISADPISLLRGAPHRELAIAFMRFVLSPEGQRLWNYRPGEPGGPRRYALRRQAIRTDVYTATDRQHMSDPDIDPFAAATGLLYRPALTGPAFNLIAPLARAVIFDPRDEVTEAWRAICDAGGPTAVPEAMAAFERLPVRYADIAAALKSVRISKDTSATAALSVLRHWSLDSITQYQEATQLAREHR